MTDVPERVADFGDPGPLRDRLVQAVLRGEKTATSSLLWEWEEHAESLPKPGKRQTVVDSHDRPVAIIEIVGVEIIRLGDADICLVRDEGEGLESVAQWRAAHEAFWRVDVDDDTPVVVERFRLVELDG